METVKNMIIAEIGQAHDGSLGIAHSYIDAIAKSGADAVKFQTHIANSESSDLEKWRVKFSKQDKTRFDYWKRMEFSYSQWKELKAHANDVGLKFLSSVFSIEAFHMMNEIGVFAWKIASGEINNFQLLKKMKKTKIPIYVSTGMSSWNEIDNVVEDLKKDNVDFTVFQCTSMYPTPEEYWGLNVIQEIKNRYSCNVGYSDHSGHIYAGLSAFTLGASILEVHVTFSKDLFGPDTSSSIDFNQLNKLVKGSKSIIKSLNNDVNKDDVSLKLEKTKLIFGKSVFASKDLKKGETINEKNIIFKKPGVGINIDDWESVKGSKLKRSIKSGTMIKFDDIIVESIVD
tara:strand:+ start:7435 stop:8463 length:1029 start_codon:yes stop_codon:yes gene_type:complete